MICSAHQILFGWSDDGGGDGWARREKCTGLWWENMKEGGQLEGLGIDEKILLIWIIKK